MSQDDLPGIVVLGVPRNARVLLPQDDQHPVEHVCIVDRAGCLRYPDCHIPDIGIPFDAVEIYIDKLEKTGAILVADNNELRVWRADALSEDVRYAIREVAGAIIAGLRKRHRARTEIKVR